MYIRRCRIVDRSEQQVLEQGVRKMWKHHEAHVQKRNKRRNIKKKKSYMSMVNSQRWITRDSPALEVYQPKNKEV